MLFLSSISSNIIFKPLINNIVRNISFATTLNLKEIQTKNENNTLVIEGVYKESPRANKILTECTQPKFCPECTLGLDIKHTDVLIISQYLRSDGCMLPRRITGLCKRQQRKMSSLVTMAQKAGLMPNIAPSHSKRDPKRRYQWKKFNKYYNESTIRC